MDFKTSIETCFKKFADFKGRASRSEFWYFYLFSYGTIGLLVFLNLRSPQDDFYWWLIGIFIVVIIVPFTAVTARRLHDVGKSGWWQLIPIYNLILWTQDSSSGISQSRSSQYSQTRSSRSRDYSETNKSRSGKNDLTDELDELQALYEDGTLSEAQFKKAKKKILG